MLKYAGGFVYNAVRWLAAEFLPGGRNTVSSRVTDLCRLLGLATIALIMKFETQALAAEHLASQWPVWLLDAALALLMGNLVKEVTTWLGARIVNTLGADFYRKGFMFNGAPFTEIFHPDGTWRRCEFGAHETICEWTDRFGTCHRSVRRPRTESGLA